ISGRGRLFHAWAMPEILCSPARELAVAALLEIARAATSGATYPDRMAELVRALTLVVPNDGLATAIVPRVRSGEPRLVFEASRGGADLIPRARLAARCDAT